MGSADNPCSEQGNFDFLLFKNVCWLKPFYSSKMSDIWDIWVIHHLYEKSRIFICRFCLYVCQNRARSTISSRGSSGTDCTDCTDLHYLELPGASPFEFSSSSLDVLAFKYLYSTEYVMIYKTLQGQRTTDMFEHLSHFYMYVSSSLWDTMTSESHYTIWNMSQLANIEYIKVEYV